MIPLRIAFISGMSGWSWGGSEELWSQAALKLNRDGCAVSASVHGWQDIPQPVLALRRAGISVQERQLREPLWRRCCRRLGVPLLPPKQRLMRKFLNSGRPNLICVSHGAFACGLDWMEYCATNGVRYCAIVQANGEAFWPAAVNLDRLRSAYRQAQAIYFVSEANRKLLEQQLALALPQAQVVRNPFNVPYDVQMPYPTPDREWRLACVARMDPCAKGQDLLFQVLALPHWRARPLTVSLYGAGAHEPTLRDLVQMHGLNDSVRFCGHNSDVVQVWREHQALILPSRIEGLPLVLVEAMLCGRVSIVTDVGGNAEIVEEGKTGFIAEGPTVALLNAALERAWAVRDHWQTFGAEAAKAVRSFVPADPAGVFAEKLLSLASSPN